MEKNCVEIFYMDIAEVMDYQYEKMYERASDQRRTRADAYRFREDRIRCIYAEALLQYGLRQYGYSQDMLIQLGQYGKPYVEIEQGQICFNISHSGKWVGIAFSTHNIGFDLEKQSKTVSGISQFSKDEQVCIMQCKETQRTLIFTKIWTKKESYLKFLGIGLYKSLNSFSTISDLPFVVDQGKRNEKAWIQTKMLDEQYIVSVCSEGKTELRMIPVKQRILESQG